jgi:peptide/nickel transport system substrate-binding protein
MSLSPTRRAAMLLAGALPAPALAQARNRPLRFAPFADLSVLDPITTTTYVTRNHGFMVFDTLYGLDEEWGVQPQMAESQSVEDDGKRILIRLRDNLRFHDGEPVRAADCAASIRRWAARDPLGQTLLARAAEISARDDRTIEIRLNRPFPLLFEALAKTSPPIAFMMPERLAKTDPARAIPEVIGSGPFRFLAGERVPGARNAYARFDGYVPRPQGRPGGSAGPKVAHVERVEWITIPDASTTANALQTGEIDWWEWPSFDLLPRLRARADIRVWQPDSSGFLPFLRFNHLHPPFDNPAIRRAVLPAIMQSDFVQAIVGQDRELWSDGVGFFPPGTLMASDEGMSALTGPRDPEASRRALAAAGYRGEPVTLLGATDLLPVSALAQVAAQTLRHAGMNVELVMSDWAGVVARRANRNPPAQGGWNAMLTYFSGLDLLHPAVHLLLRANGTAAWPGWPTLPQLETMREEWMEAPELAQRQAIARRIQAQAFIDLPYVPVGKFIQPTAHRREWTGMVSGPTAFWNIRRES